MAKVYPDIDLSPLIGAKKVVHCVTSEDAEHFLAVMRRQYPERCVGWTNTNYSSYGPETCYRPNLKMPVGYTMKYGSISRYVSDGYDIIPFSDLIIDTDIEESDYPFDFFMN